MKKLILLTSLFIFVHVCCLAQAYSPEVGSNIIFYPVKPEIKERIAGYDCFYTPSLAFKKGKYIFSKKSRFAAASNGFTSYNEIEGRLFRVDRIENVKANRDYYLIHLTREDNTPIILAIPLFPDDKDNLLTQRMMLNPGYQVDSNLLPIDEPCASIPCVVDTLYNKATNLNGKVYVPCADMGAKTGYHNNMVVYNLREYLISTAEQIEENIKLDLRKKQYIKISNVKWLSYPNLVYQRLSASFEFDDGTKCDMPIIDHVLKGETYYFGNYYIDKDVFVKEFLNEDTIDLIGKFVGKKIYYGLKKAKPKGKFFLNQDMSTYHIRQGYFVCKGWDVFFISDVSQVLLKLEDEAGVSFFSRIEDIEDKNVYSNKVKFGDLFVTEEEALECFAKIELEKKQGEEQYKQWAKKFGKDIADHLRDYPYHVERFYEYSKKYGNSIAFDIICGRVYIGWDEAKCRASWGSPNRVNTTTGRWGVREQWCYENGYLYFDNGKLITIQNIDGSRVQ